LNLSILFTSCLLLYFKLPSLILRLQESGASGNQEELLFTVSKPLAQALRVHCANTFDKATMGVTLDKLMVPRRRTISMAFVQVIVGLFV
jgi:hypothetical protein